MIRLGDIASILMVPNVNLESYNGEYIVTKDMINFHMGLFENSYFFKHVIKRIPSLRFKKVGDILHFSTSDDKILSTFFDYMLIIIPLSMCNSEQKDGFYINNRNLLGCPATEFYYFVDHPNKERIQTMLFNLGSKIYNLKISI